MQKYEKWDILKHINVILDMNVWKAMQINVIIHKHFYYITNKLLMRIFINHKFFKLILLIHIFCTEKILLCKIFFTLIWNFLTKGKN